MSGAAQARAITDASWGRTPQTLSGSFTIPESLGKRAGTNLFHSFQQFSIDSGESATFTTLSSDLGNVIARVSGSDPSLINGSLRLSAASGSAPNFFFINPNGVTIGSNARVNVPAAVHVSTANEIRFANGQVFAAGRGPDSSFTVAAPESFGFLGGGTKASSVQFAPKARISVFTDGRDIDVTAGEIRLDQASIYTASGQLRLVAVGNEAAAVPVDPAGTPVTSSLGGAIALTRSNISTAEGHVALRAGAIDIADSSSVNADPDFPKAGSIELLARDAVRISDSFVSSLMIPSGGQGPSIRVESLGKIDLGGASGGIQTVTLSDATAGDIVVKGASVALSGQTGINTFTNGVGAAGRITVKVAGHLQLSEAAGIVSEAVPSWMSTAGADEIGPAGSIDIVAGSLTIDPGGGFLTAGISSNSNFVAGPAGHISILVTGPLLLRGGGKISTSANANPYYPPFATQTAGTVSVTADTITIEGKDTDFFSSGIFTDSFGFPGSLSSGPGGRAGQVSVEAKDISVLGGPGGISADSSGPGAPGNVSVKTDRLLLDGLGIGRAYVSSTASGSGGGGAVRITASDTVTLVRGGTIEARTLSTGAGGEVVIDARKLTVDGNGLELVTGVLGISQGAGNAGDLSITAAESISLVRGGVVAASAGGAGRAGTISIATRDMLIDAQGDTLTGVRSRALPTSSGLVGRITVTADANLTLFGAPEAITIRNESTLPGLQNLVPQAITVHAGQLLMDGANLVASSSGSAPGSVIRVRAAESVIMRNDARILTSAQDGNGGPIDVMAGQYIQMRDALIESSVLGSTNGNGGNIGVVAPVLVLDNGFIQANTAAVRATGGDIGIGVDALIPSRNALLVGGSESIPFRPGATGFNVVQAAAPDGVSGNVQIATPALDLAGTLADLDAEVIDFGVLGRDICRIGTGSSMVRVGRGGLLPSISDTVRPGR